MAKRSLRHEFGKGLVEQGHRLPQLVALEADLRESTQSIQFQQVFPERYFEIGVAEQNMVSVAAGLALSGKIPVTHSFACFTSMRACEQVRTSVAYPRLNVKLYVSHGGISCGSAGPTHHATEDIAIMRAMPNMTVLLPGDAREVRQALVAALEHDGPVYIRVGATDGEDVYTDNDLFRLGKATLLRTGNDATIISTGMVMFEAVGAADLLKRDFGLNVRVLQMACVKPLDREAVLQAASETGRIVTVEDHNVLGGLGSAVCEVVAETGATRVRRIGVADHFCGVGSVAYLMEKEGISVAGIVSSVRELVASR